MTLSQKRQLFKATRINRFFRVLLFLSGGLFLTTLVAVIGADRVSPDLFYGFIDAKRDDLVACNKRFGARALFWGLLAIEVFAISRLVLFPFGKSDVDTYQLRATELDAASKEHRGRERTFTRKRAIFAFVVGAFIAYWGSYDMAYGDAGLCDSNGRRSDFVNYWWMWGVYGLRVLMPPLALYLWLSPPSSFDKQ
jgi:hypothetical protein